MELSEAPKAAPTAPRRVFFEAIANRRFEAIAKAAAAVASRSLTAQPAYSVKTNPRARMLRRANEAGLFAEVISTDELAWALECGFGPERIVYNGPVPLAAGQSRPAFAFADSIEALAAYVREPPARTLGLRLRPSMIDSRFGIPVDDEETVAELLRSSDGAGIAVSFHARTEDFGRATWREVALDVVLRAASIARRAHRRLVAFDAGGGWTPERFDADFASDGRWLCERIREAAPECTTLIVEPGQAIATPTEALLAEIVEVRVRGKRREAIVNAGYPDWPQMHTYPHRVFARGEGRRWNVLQPGPDAIGGRTCLEYDRIAGLALPASVERGQELLIGDCGAYDDSMAFRFGIGGRA